MKKIISKIGRVLTVFMLITGFLLSNSQLVNAETAPGSIKLGEATLLPGYIAGVKYNIKTVKGGGYAYCTNIHKLTAHDITAKKVGTMDAGVAYIIENGWPNKKFTGNKKKDYYITQAAVWWYLDDTQGTSNLGSAFKSTGSDDYKLRSYIKKLVSNAKKAKKKDYVKPTLNVKVASKTMELSSDGAYYVSKPIDANAKNISDKYAVKVESAPNGTIITDVNGTQKTKFSKSEKFLVKIPASSVAAGKTVSATIKVGAYHNIYKAYKYEPTDSSMQPVAIIKPFTYTVYDSIKLTATKPETPKPAPTPTPSVNILKVDKATGKTISGATLVIKNANGVVIKTFTSSESGNKFSDLPAGTYTVEETIAPAGYKLNSEPITFTLPNDNSTQEVKVYNERNETGVIINKVDKVTGNNIEGATLVVKDSNKNVIQTFESTVNGYEIKNLASGTYTVEETKAPAGYKLNSEPVSFTISDTQTTATVSVYNEPISPIVTINKVDSVTLKNIKDAEILVTDDQGKEVARFISTTDAYTIKDLTYGTYTVEEITPPDGYFLNEEKQTFTIDANHLSAQITIKDIPKTCENGGLDEDECSVDVPNTGTNGTLLSLLGMAIISLGIGYVYKNSKESNK